MLNEKLDQLLKTNINNHLKFELMVIAILVIFFFTYYFQFNQLVNVTALLSLVFIVVYIRLDYYNYKISDTNEQLEYQLNEIQNVLYKYIDDVLEKIRYSDTNNLMSRSIHKQLLERVQLTWLYTDAKLIRYLYSLLFLYQYNEDSYVQIVIGINNILKIRGELEEYYRSNGALPDGVYYFAETAEELQTKVLNFAHTFIYKVPKTYDSEIMTEHIITSLHTLIKPHVQTIKKMSIKQTVQEGVNRTTRFVNMIDYEAQPMDTSLQRSVTNKENKSYSKVEQRNRFELYI